MPKFQIRYDLTGALTQLDEIEATDLDAAVRGAQSRLNDPIVIQASGEATIIPLVHVVRVHVAPLQETRKWSGFRDRRENSESES